MSLTGLREMVVVARGNVGGARVAAGEGVKLGQAKRNKFRGPFAQQFQIKNKFLFGIVFAYS